MNSLTIYINNECNLNCSYCSVNKGNIKLKWSDKIENIIESIIKQEGIEKRIGIMGGEPLLNQEFIINLINSINKLRLLYPEKNIFITSIPTNGTIYNKKFYELLKKNNIELQFSIDNILSDIYDINRVHKNIKEFKLYDIINENLIKYNKIFGKMPRINITTNKNNVNNLFNIVKYYIENIGIKNIYIGFVAASKNNILGTKFIKEFIKIYKYYIENLIEYKFEINPIEDVLRKYFSENFTLDKINPCGLWKESVLSYNGFIYSCDLMASKGFINNDFIIGNINDGIYFENMNIGNKNIKLDKKNNFESKFNTKKIQCLGYGVNEEEKKDAIKSMEFMYKITILGIKKLSPEIVIYIKNKYGLYK